MSSSKTAVFPATKKGAVPYSSSWGLVGGEEDRLGQGMWRWCPGEEQEAGWVPGVCEHWEHSAAQQPCSIWPVLGWARCWCWQIINNNNDYGSAMHVPHGLCKKTFYIKIQLQRFPPRLIHNICP